MDRIEKEIFDVLVEASYEVSFRHEIVDKALDKVDGSDRHLNWIKHVYESEEFQNHIADLEEDVRQESK